MLVLKNILSMLDYVLKIKAEFFKTFGYYLK